MFRPSKRQRKLQEENPSCWLDCSNLCYVPTPNGVIRTRRATQHLEDLFVERFVKEIIQPHWFTLGSRLHKSLADQQQRSPMIGRDILKQRILYGTNACTRALERRIPHTLGTSTVTAAATPTNGQVSTACRKLSIGKPVLIVMAIKNDPCYVIPWLQIPVLAYSKGVPVLLLSDSASKVLSKKLQAKHVSAITFLDCTASRETRMVGDTIQQNSNDPEIHKVIDSFVSYILGKMESESNFQP